MSPHNGQKKKEGGLSWVFREPPGEWEVEPTGGPLESSNQPLDPPPTLRRTSISGMTLRVPKDDGRRRNRTA
jgi:hypothetical protein